MIFPAGKPTILSRNIAAHTAPKLLQIGTGTRSDAIFVRNVSQSEILIFESVSYWNIVLQVFWQTFAYSLIKL
jgi:hypothetical protein